MALAAAGALGGRSAFQSHDGRVVFPTSDLAAWSTCPHDGHRLWARMSDAFWVYVYKVQRCPNHGAHDWTLCPFAHRGERARRRDPRGYAYLAVSCPDYRASSRHSLRAGAPLEATCVRGLTCRYAHGIFELWLHPARFRTRMCDSGEACPRKICFFAHCAAQLRRADTVVPFVGVPVTPPYVQQLAIPPPPPSTYRPRPSTPVVAPVRILARPGVALQTSGTNWSQSSASTSQGNSATIMTMTTSAGSSSRPAPAADEEFDEDENHYALVMNMLDSLMMDA